MTCVNCQNKIESALRKEAGIESVKVSYQRGTADVVYDTDWIADEKIQDVIRCAGYEVLREPAGRKRMDRRTISLIAWIAVLSILLERTELLNRLVPGQLADVNMGYGSLFVIGLLTSVHCIAMCGGMNRPSVSQRGRRNQVKRIR